MTYNPSIPLATDRPSSSQPEILTNFSQLNAVFGNNHGTFNATENKGKHLFMQMPEQAAAPTTSVNEGALYTKEGPISTITELFFRRESSGTEVPLTGDLTVTAGTNYGITTQWGLIFNWGIITTDNGRGTITYAVPFTAATTPQTVQLATSGSVRTKYAKVKVNSAVFSNTQCGIGIDIVAATTVFYFAIGS